MAMTTWGCPAPLTCVEAGCGSRQVCNVDTGACEAKVTDCRRDASLCPANEFCDEETGRCLSSQRQCGPTQTQCPVDQTCDAEAGVCRVTGLCRADSDCARSGEVCGLVGRCEALRCEANLDCLEAGFICVAQRCAPGCELPASPCPEGSFCRAPSASEPGQCVSRCGADRECNFGFFCDLALAQPTCIKEAPCEDDLDCRVDELCSESACQAAPCQGDEDCLQGQICDRARCVGGDCQEDTFAPNHTPLQAPRLEEEVEISNLVRCAGRSDWYALQLTDGEVLEVEMIHEAGRDLDLYLLDENLEPIARDESQRSRALIRHESERPQNVYLLIDSARFDASIYSLKIARSPASSCPEDNFEQNDSQREAFNLVAQADTPLSLPLELCFGDEDWFRIPQLDAEEGLAVRWNAPQSEHIELDLFTPDGARIALPPDRLNRQLRVHVPGDYALRARHTRPSLQGPMTLTLTRQSPYSCLGAGEFASWRDALTIQAGAPRELLLCPTQGAWEIDWLKLAPISSGPVRLDLAITTTYEDFEIDVVVFELPEELSEPQAEPRAIRRATRTAAQRWELQAIVESGARLGLRLTTDEPLERIGEPNFYTVSYQYTPLD